MICLSGDNVIKSGGRQRDNRTEDDNRYLRTFWRIKPLKILCQSAGPLIWRRWRRWQTHGRLSARLHEDCLWPLPPSWLSVLSACLCYLIRYAYLFLSVLSAVSSIFFLPITDISRCCSSRSYSIPYLLSPGLPNYNHPYLTPISHLSHTYLSCLPVRSFSSVTACRWRHCRRRYD